MKRLTFLLFCLLLGIGVAHAQKRVTGVVISAEDNEPVIGASVVVPGTTIGVMTDIDGNFALEVPNSAKTLVFSYMGMKSQELPIKSVMKVVLASDDKLLDEVVVVGYGSAKKLGSVVGSVSAVANEKIEKKPVANVADALQGQVAGLQVFTPSGEPSASVSMRLRGVSSINISSEPLFILDGAPISGGAFTALNANDIESVTVLKDASSTAIYGSRAANGVVILTTKKGKKGEKPRISLSAQYGFSKMTGDKVNMMNAEQFLNFQEVMTPALVNDAAFQAEKKFIVDNGISTNWADVYFGGSAPTTQADLSIVGGSQSTNYYLSLGYYGADGIMDDSSMDRGTLRSNVEKNISQWIKAGVNLNLSYQKYATTAFGGSGNSIFNKAFAARVNRPDQTTHEIIRDENGNFVGYGDRFDFYDKIGNYNPYYLSEIQPSHRDMVRLNASTYVNLNPVKGLNIRAAQALEGFDARSSGQALPVGPFEGEGSRRESFQRYYAFTFTNTAEYKFNVAEDHHFTALVGQEAIMADNESFGISVNGLKDERLMLMSAGAKADLPSHSTSEKTFNSYFATLSYDFLDKYYFDASYRRDGSSLFGSNAQWANFFSVGAMWELKKESFFENIDWLNDLKVKVSYGSTGNSSIGEYLALGLIGSGPLYNGVGGTAIANPANPDLSWEVVKSTNVALNTRVLDRLSVDLEFYNRLTEDMLMEIPYSMTTGYSGGWGNVASMRNRGMDFTANVDILRNDDFTWTFSLNLNYNKNQITKLFNGLNEYVLGGTGLKLEVGKPYGEYFDVHWAGVDPRDGFTMWYDKNGNLTKKFSEDNMVYLGKQRYAPWSGGFGTRFTWKGLSVGADFSFMLGQYMINNERFFTENPNFANNTNQTTEMLNMWQKPGDITNIASPDCPVQFDSHLLENASFLRLKNLNVGYTLPKKWMNKTKFVQGAKVYFVGRNLLTATKYKGYDPEVDSNISLGNYPNTKQCSFGLELTF